MAKKCLQMEICMANSQVLIAETDATKKAICCYFNMEDLRILHAYFHLWTFS